MRLQSVFPLASLMLLVIPNCIGHRHEKQPPKNKAPKLHSPHRPRTGLSDEYEETKCAEYDYVYNLTSTVKCSVGQYCGIEKATGKIQGCVSGDQCPDDVLGSFNTIFCDPSMPICCCDSDSYDYDYDDEGPCNFILNHDSDSQWNRACRLDELKNLPVCQQNPTHRVYCAYTESKDSYSFEECSPSEYCAIDKKDGQMKKCVESTKCPGDAKDSDEIVCDSTSPFCCCQNVVGADDRPESCNNIMNSHSNSVWFHACSLPELENLEFCKDDPTEVVFCTHEDPFGNVLTNEECKPSEFCGIDKTNGKLRKCLKASECPASAKDSDRIVCDPGATYCCCQDVHDFGSSKNPCNNILNWQDTSKWEQACRLPELKPLQVCKAKPTKPTTTTTSSTTPPPPPTPPAPSTTPAPVKKEDMNQECLNFCQDKKPKYYPDIFRVYCGSGSTENQCPSPCPSDCDRHCWDGSHLECPALGGAAPPPPPREGEPGRGTDYIDLHGDYRDTTTDTVLGSFISLLSLLILIGCVYICCCGPKQAVAVVPYQQQQQIAYQSNPFQTPGSTAATSSGTSLSSSESSLSSVAVKK